MKITEKTANKIYDVLVEHCGKHEHDEHDRQSFVWHVTDEKQRWTEWRFQGALGFGGKVWNSGGFYVSCYSEDNSPERRSMIRAANAELGAIYQEVIGA